MTWYPVDVVQRRPQTLRDGTPVVGWPCSPLKRCMSFRIRSTLRRAFLALPLRMRHRRRSTSATITVSARIRAGLSVGNDPTGHIASVPIPSIWTLPLPPDN